MDEQEYQDNQVPARGRVYAIGHHADSSVRRLQRDKPAATGALPDLRIQMGLGFSEPGNPDF